MRLSKLSLNSLRRCSAKSNALRQLAPPKSDAGRWPELGRLRTVRTYPPQHEKQTFGQRPIFHTVSLRDLRLKSRHTAHRSQLRAGLSLHKVAIFRCPINQSKPAERSRPMRRTPASFPRAICSSFDFQHPFRRRSARAHRPNGTGSSLRGARDTPLRVSHCLA